MIQNIIDNDNIIIDKDGKFIKVLHVNNIPAIIFVNTFGKVAGYYEGKLSREELKQLVLALKQSVDMAWLFSPGAPGSRAPNIQGIDFSARPYTALFFVKASCEYCQLETPQVIEFAKKHAEMDVWIIPMDSTKNVREMYDVYKVPHNIHIYDIRPSEAAKLASVYGVRATPTHIVINQQGVVIHKSQGYSQTIYLYDRIKIINTILK